MLYHTVSYRAIRSKSQLDRDLLSAESTCRWIMAVHLIPCAEQCRALKERSSKLHLPYTADLPKYSYYSAFTLRASKMGNSQANDAINDIDAWWLCVCFSPFLDLLKLVFIDLCMPACNGRWLVRLGEC